MIAPFILFIIIICYVLLLFALAYYAERREKAGRSIVNNPYVYSLSLAVYGTAWTFYGSVGTAASAGPFYLAVYVGATIMVFLWPVFLRKIIKIAKANRITTISDFIALRYGKSLSLSVLVTIVAVIGLIPYVGLQLKAITNTFIIISGKTALTNTAGLVIALMLGVFTIMFGTRRLDLSERHGGIVFAIAFESLVKLASFLVIGIFVTYGLFDGFQDVFDKISRTEYSRLLLLGTAGATTSYSEWFALVFLAMMAIVFLPRQFHMAVVENYDEAHLKKTVWVFPLYLLLINLFVLPIAFGGLLLEGSGKTADYFVLNLPLHHGGKWLAILAFLGGFASANGMIIVESLALSTMVMNSIVMPLLFKFHDVPKFSGILLNIKRFVILGIIFWGYLFTVTVGPLEGLVEIGLKSFEAVTLFAPAFILGLYWKRGNKTGAMAGLIAGFLVWFYTVIIPVMLAGGMLDKTGIIGSLTQTEFFNPKGLFGVSGLGKWGHTLFWSMLFNVVFYIGGSAFTRQSKEEEVQSLVFVESYEAVKGLSRGSFTASDLEDILSQYMERTAVRNAVDAFVAEKKMKKDELSAGDLSALRDEAEKMLSGAVGPAMASVIFENRFVLTENERREISESIRRSTESVRRSHLELSEAMEELRKSEGKYRGIFENAIEGIFQTTMEGRFLSANPAMARMLAYSSPEELVASVSDTRGQLYVRPGDRDAVVSALLEQGEIFGQEVQFYRKDKEKIWVAISARVVRDDSGKPLFIEGLNTDVSERKRAEEALRESEGKYRTLVDNINIGIYRNTGGRGRFIQANPAMPKMFGYDTVEEFMEVQVADLYRDPEDRKSFVQEVKRNGFVKDRELALKKKDGTPIWCSVTATVQYDEQGEVKWMDGVIEDITERKRAEEERKRLEAQLLQAQKMEAVGQLSGGIAHDFNNILTAIMGYANLVKKKTKEDALLQTYTDQILTASARATNLTRNLLAFSRKQVINLRAVNVNEIITGTEKMLFQLIREDIELKTVLADKPLTIMADSGQIEQVLINLATNARDAMPEGGSLTIETKLVDVDAEYERKHLFAKQGMYACISVTDTGAGMDEKTKARIFEPFFTTKETGKGTGLGLSTVYGIIQQHSGAINVYSEPGLGTTFRIYLPVIESKPEETGLRELPEPKGGVETVLLAEDDVNVRDLTKTILEEAGYTVLEAADGEEAIQVFAEHQDEVQLVLLDVIMPKKNGKEVHNWIKSARPETRVLFMSGYSADIIFKKGVLEEGLNLISKPAAPQDLLRKVREVLDAERGRDAETGPQMQKSVSASLSPGERVVQEAEASRLRRDKPDARAGHAGSILIVDDDPNVLAYVSHLLEEHGYATHPCGSAREALRALKDIRADVVLTDIVMPGTSGIELLETIHGIDPELPVILLTAYADLEKAVESIKKGAFDFIMKPYDPEQLLRSLEKAVRYSRLVRLEMEYQDRLEEFNTEIDTLVAERTMSLMALTVADRVRNPATVIALSCKKIMERGVPDELGKYVAFIRDEAGKLETIVKNFQNLLGSRRSVFAYEDINEVVRNVIFLVEKESAPKGIKIVQRLAEGPLRMNMQKNLLRVAVQHVLRNAVEATPLGGEVTVATASESGKVVLSLADTGSGISEQDTEKIFDPFYSTKVHRYGMGLPLVKQIVSEHLGEIELSTVLGKGTTFRMIFPSRWQEK